MPYIPNLAGQKDFYLVQSLMAYKAGERKSLSANITIDYIAFAA